ncbi:S41 family peptidase [Anaerococcus urinomassiliensis]|uniref:S41 family peptidase n=1 Tax=Anaerococcus urinomassiliensis TaxID=1745712 RepID=UPI00093DD24E|nr:S41 family peptidase [Anaerococcus urinomassiliensis]
MSRDTKRKSRQNKKLDKRRYSKNTENISPARRQRLEKNRKQRRRKFLIRRIVLLAILVIILVFASKAIVNSLYSYKKMGYPGFRDEVLDSIGSEVFVSPSENRSLTSAEKITDFDDLYDGISKNYAVDKLNTKDFLEFSNEYTNFRKKIAASKTDQDYYSILNQYLEVLDDTRTFVIDKKTYDSLFDYYRNKGKSPQKTVLENPQAVDRYKRLLDNANNDKPSMQITKASNNVASITLKDFRANEVDEDIKKITDFFRDNGPIGTIILDLSDNNSIDSSYWIELSKILIANDYHEDNIIFYRSKLFQDSLKNFKEDENSPYKTAFVKNDSSKYPDEIDLIDPNHYLYYDQLSLDIKRNTEYAVRKIYVLTNENTANEAIKFARVLQTNGAYIVKNALESSNTHKDVIYNAPSNLYILEHSGLIVSINSSFSKNEENLYLEYDQKINSKEPINSMLNILR